MKLKIITQVPNEMEQALEQLKSQIGDQHIGWNRIDQEFKIVLKFKGENRAKKWILLNRLKAQLSKLDNDIQVKEE